MAKFIGKRYGNFLLMSFMIYSEGCTTVYGLDFFNVGQRDASISIDDGANHNLTMDVNNQIDSSLEVDSCIAESDLSICSRWDKHCDSFEAADYCGVKRTVNCGSCSKGTCGSGGRANVCGDVKSYSVSNETITSVWNSSSTNAWLVDSKGYVARWNGSTWSPLSKSNALGLYDIWGVNSNNIWTVGTNGSILQWNSSWSTADSGVTTLLFSIFGITQDDVWVVGAKGTILHKTSANTWENVSQGANDFFGIISLSSTAVYVVGQKGTVAQWNGVQWNVQNISTEDLRSVWANTTSSIWTVGTKGTILHWNGTEWTSMPIEGINMTLNKVWGTSSSDLWIVGDQGTLLHWDGNKWRHSVLVGATSNFIGISGTLNPKDPVWVYGENGTLFQLNSFY